MDRLSLGLGVAAALLLVSNVYFWRANSALEDERQELSLELARAKAERREDDRPEPMDRMAALRAQQARAMRRGVAGKGGEGPAGRAGGPGQGLPPAAQERLVHMRDQVRSQALERVLVTVERIGAERGWEGSTIAEVSDIFERSFEASTELRDAVRSREVDPVTAREDMSEMRDQTQAELTELLGESEHQALRDAMRSSGAKDPADEQN